MKKRTTVLIIVLLAAATWAGATYVVGARVEKNYAAILNKYRHSGPFSINGQKYQRGFLSSRAETTLHFELPISAQQKADAPESLTLILVHQLKHGPLPGTTPALAHITTRLRDFQVDGKSQQKLLKRFPQLRQPLAATRIAFDGAILSQLQIPSLTLTEDDLHFDWDGLSLESRYSPMDRAIQGTFSTLGLQLSTKNGQLDWNGGHGSFNLNKALPMLFVGTQELRLEAFALQSIAVAGREIQTIDIDGLNISAESHFDGHQVHYRQTLKLEGLQIEEQRYGPGLMQIELNNLAAKPLSDFQIQLKNLYFNNGRANPEELPAQLLPVYSRLFIGLAAGEPEFIIRQLKLSTPKGRFAARARVKHIGHQDNSGLTLLLAPATLLHNLEADAELKVAEALVKTIAIAGITKRINKARANRSLAPYSDDDLAALAAQQYQEQLDALVRQNFIVREGNTLRAAIDFNQGTLKLNGRRLPLL